MIFFLGFLVGLALVAPIGPVSLTLFGLGVEQGRRPALAGAGAVVAVDGLFVPIALVGASFVTALDASLLRSVEVLLGLLIVGVAFVLVRDAARVQNRLGGVERPARTLGMVAAANPLTFAAWLALAVALPAGVDAPVQRALFGVGLIAASGIWHVALAVGAGWLGPRLDHRRRLWLTRGSGVVLVVVAASLIV